MSSPTFCSGRARPAPPQTPRDELLINSQRESRKGVCKSRRSNLLSSSSQRRGIPPLSKNRLAFALCSTDPQFLPPPPKRTEDPEQRAPNTSHPRSCSWTPLHGKSQARHDCQPQGKLQSQAISQLKFPISTSPIKWSSNLLDNLLTTAEERTFLRSMMPITETPNDAAALDPRRESVPETPQLTPSMRGCSNFLENVLTTSEERTFLRSMMPVEGTPGKGASVNPGYEKGHEVLKIYPFSSLHRSNISPS